MASRKVTLSFSPELWARLTARVPRRRISRFVAEAAARRLDVEVRAELRKRIKEQSLARAEEDQRLAEEFFAAEQQVDDRIPHP